VLRVAVEPTQLHAVRSTLARYINMLTSSLFLLSAAQDYMAALAETPEDCWLYMNISLTHLKMGHVNEVRLVAFFFISLQ
jgi:hypothetical protein